MYGEIMKARLSAQARKSGLPQGRTPEALGIAPRAKKRVFFTERVRRGLESGLS